MAAKIWRLKKNAQWCKNCTRQFCILYTLLVQSVQENIILLRLQGSYDLPPDYIAHGPLWSPRPSNTASEKWAEVT